jgi:hypothetical protein
MTYSLLKSRNNTALLTGPGDCQVSSGGLQPQTFRDHLSILSVDLAELAEPLESVEIGEGRD